MTQDVNVDKNKHMYAVVGELVILSNAIDHQLNHVMIAVLNIAGPIMVEPVVATIDTRLKTEILKERAKHISNREGKKESKNIANKLKAFLNTEILSVIHRRSQKAIHGHSSRSQQQECSKKLIFQKRPLRELLSASLKSP